MAARLVRRLKLQPRVDVFKVAKTLADVSEKRFPIEIDGLCLDLKTPGKKPKVWISSRISEVRRRFTLAHEIGHIFIPWHTGSIVDNVDVPDRLKGRYQTMEAEANRFAAELLMPSDWVREKSKNCDHIAGLFSVLHRVADVSFKAALYRTIDYGPPGYIVAKVQNGVVIQTRRTRGTISYPPENGALLSLIDMPTAGVPVTTSYEQTDYVWWKVDNEVRPGPQPQRAWRQILIEILDDVPQEHRKDALTRVNAIVGNALGKLPIGASTSELYGRVLAVTKNRAADDFWIGNVLRHRLFDDYILARCYSR